MLAFSEIQNPKSSFYVYSLTGHFLSQVTHQCSFTELNQVKAGLREKTEIFTFVVKMYK